MSLVRKSCTIWHTSSQAIDLLKALYFSRFPARKTCIWAQKMQTENSSLGLHMKSSKSEELFKASQRRLHHSPQLPQPNHPWKLCSGSQCKTHSVLCCAFSYDCLLCKEFHACKPRPVASVTWKRQFSATTSTTSASWYPSPSSLLWCYAHYQISQQLTIIIVTITIVIMKMYSIITGIITLSLRWYSSWDSSSHKMSTSKARNLSAKCQLYWTRLLWVRDVIVIS